MSEESQNFYRLMYQSDAIESLTDKDVDEIVSTSKRNNTAVNITGFLIFDNGQFMQLLEGEEEVVKKLYHDRIAKDPRHKNSKIIKESHGPRMCSYWSMAKLPVGMFPYKKLP